MLISATAQYQQILLVGNIRADCEIFHLKLMIAQWTLLPQEA